MSTAEMLPKRKTIIDLDSLTGVVEFLTDKNALKLSDANFKLYWATRPMLDKKPRKIERIVWFGHARQSLASVPRGPPPPGVRGINTLIVQTLNGTPEANKFVQVLTEFFKKSARLFTNHILHIDVMDIRPYVPAIDAFSGGVRMLLLNARSHLPGLFQTPTILQQTKRIGLLKINNKNGPPLSPALIEDCTKWLLYVDDQGNQKSEQKDEREEERILDLFVDRESNAHPSNEDDLKTLRAFFQNITENFKSARTPSRPFTMRLLVKSGSRPPQFVDHRRVFSEPPELVEFARAITACQKNPATGETLRFYRGQWTTEGRVDFHYFDASTTHLLISEHLSLFIFQRRLAALDGETSNPGKKQWPSLMDIFGGTGNNDEDKKRIVLTEQFYKQVENNEANLLGYVLAPAN